MQLLKPDKLQALVVADVSPVIAVDAAVLVQSLQVPDPPNEPLACVEVHTKELETVSPDSVRSIGARREPSVRSVQSFAISVQLTKAYGESLCGKRAAGEEVLLDSHAR